MHRIADGQCPIGRSRLRSGAVLRGLKQRCERAGHVGKMGMKRSFSAFGAIAVLALAGCGDDQSSSQRSTLPPGIGDVSVVVQMVHGTLANQDLRRMLTVRDDVYWHELIETERESATEVEFVDGTRLTLGADAKVNLDEFVYGGPPGTDRMVMTVTKGMSRFVTGTMDKAAYEIRAPGAIIGVRGTEFTLVVDPDAGTTLCMVHKGEVEIKRPSDGQRVIVQPGEASKASSKNSNELTPPAPSPTEAVKSSDTLRAVVDAARDEQRAAHNQSDSGRQPDRRATGSDRDVAMRSGYDTNRDHMQDFIDQLRRSSGGDHRSVSPSNTNTANAGNASHATNPAAAVSGHVSAVDVAGVATSRPSTSTEGTSAGKADTQALAHVSSGASDDATKRLADSQGEQATAKSSTLTTTSSATTTTTASSTTSGIASSTTSSGCSGSSNCQTPLVPLEVGREAREASKTRVHGG